MNKELVAIIITISVGVIVRVVYDFLVKPIFKKGNPKYSQKQLKLLIKKSSFSFFSRRLLVKFLSSTENPLLKEYYVSLSNFNKRNLSEKEQKSLEELLKQIKKDNR